MNPDSNLRRSNMWERLSLHKLGGWLKKDEAGAPQPEGDQQEPGDEKSQEKLNKRSSRKVVPGLPRPATFKRQESERRDRLVPYEPGHDERRAISSEPRAQSVDRQSVGTSKRAHSPPPRFHHRSSAPESLSPYASDPHESFMQHGYAPPKRNDRPDDEDTASMASQGRGDFPPPLSTTGPQSDNDGTSDGVDELVIQQELDAKWILNLSMHFRDMSDREKFFVTYAEQPNRWRRVTVSIDFRDAEPESLEADLKSLHYQRDKSARIYESIRDSLPDIQFYETVTNLKLETREGRLHVHVTEDMNEIIPYPSVSAITHLDCPMFRESDVNFESHLSGFVYKVSVHGQVYIKKEIPGPESVEEFLYETNCLSRVRGAHSVIQFAGVIVDDRRQLVTGLLIDFAEKGALVDLLYDWKNTAEMTWPRRERWAKQIVQGLSEIHESGFVQGDFTLSNIVIDADDDAKIIDINRRGCPVGWEPPELARLIEAGQKISIYIGVKSDLFQLGMVLWALAEQKDEPEREERPLLWTQANKQVPDYFKRLVEACLCEEPRGRPSAKELLSQFPEIDLEASRPATTSRHSLCTHRSDKEYIDPRTAVGRDDIDQHRRSPERDNQMSSVNPSSANLTDVFPPTEYDAHSSGSYVVAQRHGPTSDTRQTPEYSPYVRASSNVSLNDSELENDTTSLSSQPERWEQVYIDGDTRLVNRGGPLGIDEHEFPAHEQSTACIPTPRGEQTDPLRLDLSEPGPEAHSPELAGIGCDRDLPPPPLPFLSNHRASFLDRIQQRNSHNVDVLAGLVPQVQGLYENRNNDLFSRDRFGPPTHQDSGFGDGDMDTVLLGLSSPETHLPDQIDDFDLGLESHDEFSLERPSCSIPDDRDNLPLGRRTSANTVRDNRSSITTTVPESYRPVFSLDTASASPPAHESTPDLTLMGLTGSGGEPLADEHDTTMNGHTSSASNVYDEHHDGMKDPHFHLDRCDHHPLSTSSVANSAVWFPWMSRAEGQSASS
ncbi:Protein kinase domain-containing protein [Lasiodiplodia theobromae]|uniref:Protein kinase domain-containing protein n=1 Tax=Lasiodiplodia theobromae TaxID=45133 RepID=UPI0015C3A925|nr:Protein kinase domain-containing protein [Lasiodiplodia theobromae]KAF4534505.1 Protein kinase domain-containing protein [Lasiodiplodia theobromae]